MQGKINSFGSALRAIRERKKLLLRQAAAHLEVDTAYVSKLERGEKRATKEQVLKLAEFYATPEEHLLELWLADKVMLALQGEAQSQEALKIVSKKIRKNK